VPWSAVPTDVTESGGYVRHAREPPTAYSS
jgi:hypothetical protein